jgi:integrase
MSTARFPTSPKPDSGRFAGGARITLVEGTRHPNPPPAPAHLNRRERELYAEAWAEPESTLWRRADATRVARWARLAAKLEEPEPPSVAFTQIATVERALMMTLTARLAAGIVIEPAGTGESASSPARARRSKLSPEVRAELRRLRREAPLRRRRRGRARPRPVGPSPSGELADWAAGLPDRSRYGIVSALRQALEAAVRWGHLDRNPAKLAGRNPQPPPRAIRVYGRAELEALAAELEPRYRPLPAFAAATGLRPEEWGALERRDVDCAGGVLSVRRTISSGAVVELAKTARSRRQFRYRRARSRRSSSCRRGSTRPTCSPPCAAGPATSTTCAGAYGARPWSPRASRNRPGSTTCARRSPLTRSPPA